MDNLESGNTTSGFGEEETKYAPAFSFDSAPKVLPSDKTVNVKTNRVMFGLTKDDDEELNNETVSARISSGDERGLRQSLSASEDQKLFRTKQSIIQELARTREDGRITQEEYNTVMGLTRDNLEDPSTIIEKKFARKIVDETLSRKGGDTYEGAVESDPNTTDAMVSAMESKIQYTEALKDIITDLEDRASNQGWFGWGADAAKSLFVPFYNTYKMGNLDKNSSLAEALLFPGSSFQKERERLFSLPTVEEFKRQTKESLDRISNDNPSLAVEFAKGLMDYSIGDQFWTSALSSLDFAAVAQGVGPSVKLLKKSTKISSLIKDTEDTLRSVGRTVAHPNSTIKDAVAATGDVPKAVEAAVMSEPSIVKKISEALPVGSPKSEVAKWLDAHVPSIAVPDSAFPDTPFDLAKGYVANLRQVLGDNSSLALKAIFDTNFVSRIDKTTGYEQGALAQAERTIKDLFGANTSGAVLNTKFVPGSESGVNVDRVTIQLGKSDGTLFKTPASAKVAITKTYGINVDKNSFDIVKVGDGYVVEFSKAVNELDPAIRDFVLHNESKTPVSTVKMFLGHITSADFNLSKSQNAVRSVATSAHQELSDIISEIAKPIGRLDKKESTRLFQFMDESSAKVKKMEDGSLSRGIFYRTQQEFSNEFFSKFGEFPTAKQTQAYFTAIQLNDLDYVIRNLNIYQAKAFRGVGEIKFSLQVPSKTEEDVFETVQTKGIEGVFVDNLPFDEMENSRVLVIEKNGAHNILDLAELSAKQRDLLKEFVKKSNSRIVQIFDPSGNPLKDYLPNYKDGIPIEYVVSTNPKWGNLSMTQVPYNEGGHAIENASFRVKSPKMVPTTTGKMYGGDTTFSAHVVEKEAREFASAMEEARLALKKASENKIKKGRKSVVDLTEVQKVLEDLKLPFDAEEFAGFFKSDGPLSLDMPIKVVRDGQRYSDVVDLKSMKIRNYMTSPNNMSAELDRRLTSERGMGSQSFAKGGANNAVWTPVKARMLDSKSIIQKTLGEVIKSRVYDDYVYRSSREFVEQFGHLLHGGREKARQAPIFNLLHPSWKTNGDPVELAAAKKMQRAVSLLVYSPSELSKQVTAAKSSILNGVYSRFGGKAAEFLEDSAIFKTRDPTKFFRSVAFHTQIGLFNPVQFVLNTQTLFHMSAVSPKHAFGAMKDSILMRFMNYNNDEMIVKGLSKKSGYKYFTEMASELNRSGFANIGGTNAYLDNALEPKTIQTKWGSFLDFGTVFFKESEGGLKRSAYAIAYREWREASPNGVMSDLVRQKILARAKNLNVQMSRDSMNIYQHGVWSIPLQFTSYNFRLTEQLLQGIFSGTGALTRGEAARALSMYSLLYGFPTAVGAAVGVWPVYESVKSYALENGIDLDSNKFVQIMSRGLLSAISDMSGDSKWNFAERWGPGNSTMISDILDGNTSVLEALTGPPGSIVSNIASAGSPLLRSLTSVFSDDPGTSYPLTIGDAISASRNVAIVNNATRAFMAYNTGLWVTKNGIVQTDVDSSQALFAAILGLSPQEAVDTYTVKKILANRGEHQREIINEATKEWQSYTDNVRAGQMDQASDNLKRMKFLVVSAGVNPLEANEIMRKIISTHADQWSELEMKLIKSSRTPEEFLNRVNQRVKALEDKKNLRSNN